MSVLEAYLDRYLPLGADERSAATTPLEAAAARTADDPAVSSMIAAIELAAGLPAGPVPAALCRPGAVRVSMAASGCTAAAPAWEGELPRHLRLGFLLSGVQELDVTGNAFSSWAVVSELLAAAPRLRVLDVSANPLSGAAEGTGRPHGALQSLVANGTGADAATLGRFAARLPALTALSAASNGWDNDSAAAAVRGCAAGATRLRRLDLSSNPIDDVSALLPALAGLLALDELVLRRCPLRSWPASPCPEAAPAEAPTPSSSASSLSLSLVASRLVRLNLDGCLLPSLRHLCAVATWPALRSLRCASNPWVDTVHRPSAEAAGAAGRLTLAPRMHIIGRAGRLCDVNGSRVRPGEAEAAERFLVRYASALGDCPGLPGVDYAPPLRLAALVARYGDLRPLATALPPRSVLALHVTAEACGGGRSRLVQVPQAWPVGRLRRWASWYVHALRGGGPAGSAGACTLDGSEETGLFGGGGEARLPGWFEAMAPAERKAALGCVPGTRLWAELTTQPGGRRLLLRDNKRCVFGLGLADGDGLTLVPRDGRADGDGLTLVPRDGRVGGGGGVAAAGEGQGEAGAGPGDAAAGRGAE